MVPKTLQRELWAVYKDGQEITKQVSLEYLFVQTACRVAIAYRERGEDTALIARLVAELKSDANALALDWGLVYGAGAPQPAVIERVYAQLRFLAVSG